MQIAFDPALVQGRRSRAVSGRLTAAEAARRLLAGSGLTVHDGGGLLTIAPSAAAPGPAGPAPVAPAEAFPVEDVVVTGYAAGLRRSLQAKQDAHVVIDAVSADDVGRLPSNNLAEALSRLPGVNAVREHDTGEGDRITIRGLSTELNGYALNGLRLAGAGSYNDRFYRGVRLNVLPSQGVGAVEVIKTLTPDRDGDALGGVIDIRTPNAFDDETPPTVVSASAGWLDKHDRPGSEGLSGALSRRFGERWGLYANAVWSHRRSRFEQVGAHGDNQPTRWYADSQTLGWEDTAFVMRGLDLGFGDTEIRRLGLNASLDYRGEDHDWRLRGHLNGYRRWTVMNRLNIRNEVARNSARLTQRDPAALGLAQPDAAAIGFDPALGRIYAYTPDQIVDRGGDGRITDADRSGASFYSLIGASGAWDPRDVRARRFWEAARESGSLAALDFGGVSRLGAWTADYDLSWSQAKDAMDAGYRLEFRGFPEGAEAAGVRVAPEDDARFPLWFLSEAGMAAIQDPARFDFARLYGQVGGADETLWQGQLNLERRLDQGPVASLKGGLRLLESRRTTHGGDFLELSAPGAMSDFAPFFGPSADSLFGGRYAGDHRLGLTLDRTAVLKEIGRAQAGRSALFTGFAVPPKKAVMADAARFVFRERGAAAYLMATGRVGGTDWVGGLRVEHTANLAESFLRDPVNGDGFVRARSDYTAVLPSLHLKRALAPDTVARAAVWTSYARPDIARIASQTTYLYNPDPDGDGVRNPADEWTLSEIRTGAVALKPIRAVNYDLSIERYRGARGAYSLALFHKDIDNFLFRSSSSNIRDGTSGQAAANGVVVTSPNEGGAATVQGVELSVQEVFNRLPAPFDGLGVAANLTLQRARARTGLSWHPPGHVQPMMETPESVANVQVFWARDGWETYVAWSRQSKFLEDLQDFGNNPYEQAYAFVDLTIRRALGGGATASLEVQNLLDAHTYWYTVDSGADSSRAYTRNGRSLWASVTYAF